MNQPENERLLVALEVALLDSAVRGSAAQLNDVFADEFVEFGSSGRAYTKNDIIAFLLEESSTEKGVSRRAEDIKVHWLAENSAFVNYKLVRTEPAGQKTSLRTSIWKYSDARWQMVFHQGTDTEIASPHS